MAFTATQLATLEAAFLKGTKSVRFPDGKMVEYHDLDQLWRAVVAARADVAAADADAAPRVVRTTFAKGC